MVVQKILYQRIISSGTPINFHVFMRSSGNWKIINCDLHRWSTCQCPCLSAFRIYSCIANNRKWQSFEIPWFQFVCPFFLFYNYNCALCCSTVILYARCDVMVVECALSSSDSDALLCSSYRICGGTSKQFHFSCRLFLSHFGTLRHDSKGQLQS